MNIRFFRPLAALGLAAVVMVAGICAAATPNLQHGGAPTDTALQFNGVPAEPALQFADFYDAAEPDLQFAFQVNAAPVTPALQFALQFNGAPVTPDLQFC